MKRRKMTKFGRVLNVLLGTTACLSFFLLLGFTGECELGGSLRDYIVRAVPCLIVFGASILLHNKIFE